MRWPGTRRRRSRRGPGRRERSSCSRGRALGAGAPQHVEPAVEQDAVELERERTLHPDTVEAAIRRASDELAVRVHEPGDALQSASVTAGYQARTSSARSAGGVGAERSMRSSSRWTASPISVAMEARRPRLAGRPRRRSHAHDPLGVVAVGAALEERERAEREACDAVSGGSGTTVSSWSRGAGGGSVSPLPSKSASCRSSSPGDGLGRTGR